MPHLPCGATSSSSSSSFSQAIELLCNGGSVTIWGHLLLLLTLS